MSHRGRSASTSRARCTRTGSCTASSASRRIASASRPSPTSTASSSTYSSLFCSCHTSALQVFFFFLDFPPDNTLILPALLLITFNCPLNMTHHTDCSLSLCLSAHFAYICEYIVLVRRLTAAGTEQRTTAGGARAGELRHAVLRAKSRAARCFRPHSRLYQSDPATRTISFPQPDFADTAHSSLVGWNRTRPS